MSDLILGTSGGGSPHESLTAEMLSQKMKDIEELINAVKPPQIDMEGMDRSKEYFLISSPQNRMKALLTAEQMRVNGYHVKASVSKYLPDDFKGCFLLVENIAVTVDGGIIKDGFFRAVIRCECDGILKVG